MLPDKPKKIPDRVARVVGYCQAGQTVCLSIRHSDVGDEKVYWLEPSGRPVGEWTVKRAIDLGLLVPAGDSLFPGMDSQTYRAAHA